MQTKGKNEDIAHALANFISIGGSMDKTAKALSLTRKTVSIVENEGISSKNKKVIKAVGLRDEDLEEKNFRETLNKIKEATILKEELYQKFLALNIDSTSKVYELIDKIDKTMKENQPLKVHMALWEGAWQKLICAYWSERELKLETSYYKEEENLYCVEVIFPKWVEEGLDLSLSFEHSIFVGAEEGTWEWEDEVICELAFQIGVELNRIKDELNDENNSLQMLERELIDDIIDRFENDSRMSWGDFSKLEFMKDLDLPLAYSMENIILLGRLMLDGRTEEAMKVVETANVPKELYDEYSLR